MKTIEKSKPDHVKWVNQINFIHKKMAEYTLSHFLSD